MLALRRLVGAGALIITATAGCSGVQPAAPPPTPTQPVVTQLPPSPVLQWPPTVPLDPQLRAAWEAGLAGEEAEAESNNEAQTCWTGPNGDIPTACGAELYNEGDDPGRATKPDREYDANGYDANGDGQYNGYGRCGTACGEAPTSGDEQHDYGCEQGCITEGC